MKTILVKSLVVLFLAAICHAGDADLPKASGNAANVEKFRNEQYSPANDFEYTIKDGEVTITAYNGDSPEVSIPPTIEGMPVTRIGRFQNVLQEDQGWCAPDTPDYYGVNYDEDGNPILIEEGITFVFSNGVASVTVPDSVTFIGADAFYACGTLKRVSIGAGVRTGLSFWKCWSLESIVVSDGNGTYKTVDGVLFSKDGRQILLYPCGRKASEYVIPDGVTEIGDYAFAYCGSLESVVIPDGVTAIGDRAFEACGSLVSVVIPDSVTAIGDSAFAYCDSLESVVIGDGVTEVGYFEEDGEDSWFESYSWFEGCWSLATVTIGSGVTENLEYVFSECESLEAINVSEDNAAYLSQDGVLFNKDKTRLIKYPSCKEESEYAVPATVTEIAGYAFSYCENLTSVALSDGIAVIGEHAFYGCSGLKSMVLPATVKEIGDSAFSQCSFESINIPESVVRIGNLAFLYCRSLTSVVIPDSVTEIGEGAFFESGLESVAIGSGLKEISYAAFGRCMNLVDVRIADGVETIGYCAFALCTSLESIELPSSVKLIRGGAFGMKKGEILSEIRFKGAPPEFSLDLVQPEIIIAPEETDICYPTPITFHVPCGMGWEEWEVPEGVTVVLSKELEIREGWNLCALPFAADADSVALLNEAGPCWGWDGSDYVQLEGFQAGQGFWLYAQNDMRLALTGVKTELAELREGWNLVSASAYSGKAEDARKFTYLPATRVYSLTSGENSTGDACWIFVE